MQRDFLPHTQSGYTALIEPGTNSRMAYLGMQVGAGNWKHLAEVGGWARSRKQPLLGSML